MSTALEEKAISQNNYGEASYWNERYKKTDSTFDWYVDWSCLKDLTTSLAKPTDSILHVGCGNSELAHDMAYAPDNQVAFPRITNIDISDVLIEKMKKRYEFAPSAATTASTTKKTKIDEGGDDSNDSNDDNHSSTNDHNDNKSNNKDSGDDNNDKNNDKNGHHIDDSDDDTNMDDDKDGKGNGTNGTNGSGNGASARVKSTLKWYCMDAREMAFPSSSFDVVIEKGTMDAVICENSEDLILGIFAECSRVLKPGGQFLLITHGAPRERLFYIDRDEFNWDVSAFKLAFSSSALLIRQLRALLKGQPLSSATPHTLMMAMSKVKSMASFADQLGCGDNDNGTESGANASDDPGDSKKGGDDNTNKNGDTTHHTSNDNDDDDEYRKIAPSSFVPRRGSNYLEIDLDGTETFPSPAESSYCFVYVCKKHAV